MSDPIPTIIQKLAPALPGVPEATIAEALSGLFRGERASIGGNAVSFSLGDHNTITNATFEIGDIVAGDKISVTVELPHPLDPLPAALALFASLPLDRLPAPTTALPAASRMLLGRNPQFVGRAQDLLALALAIADPQPTVIVPAVLSGLGGVGKTSTAVEFAYRYGQYFAGGVFWINCADPAVIPGEVAACAATLGLAVASQPLDQQVAAVRHAWQEPLPRLLVFDNCEDPRLLTDWMPALGGCRVAVTARRGEWANAYRVPIGVLTRSESTDLLRRLAPHATDGEAGAVAEALGDLPLALHLAGSYLARTAGHETVGQYLERLAADPLEHPAFKGRALRAGDELPTRHEQDVAKTFALSFGQLDSAKPIDSLACHLLACLACLAPGELVPHDLLWGMLPEGTETLDGIDALDRTVALGLATQEVDAAVRVHRLVHGFLGRALPADQALPLAEAGLAARIAAVNEAGYPQAGQGLVPHGLWLGRPERTDASFGPLFNNLAYLVQSMGDYAGARPLYERALAIDEAALGPEQPETAVCMSNLALLLHATGDYAGARPLFERALRIMEAALGPDHPDTAKSLSNLASLVQSMGDYAGARPLFERALRIREAALGAEHPDTATSVNNLAYLLHAIGDNEGARPLFERALQITEATLGPDHPETAVSLNNLAGMVESMGDYAGARLLYERSLAILEAALGAEHPDTAASLSNLAGLWQTTGDYERARPLFEQALRIREAALGPDHPDTATSASNLASLLRAMGDYAGARPLFERALRIHEAALGPEHPDTATSANNLAGLLQGTEDYAGARPLFEQALRIREAALGAEHPDTAVSLGNLAGLLESTGDYAGARPLYERALAMFEATFGPEHPDTATSANNLAYLLQAMEDYAGARPLFERALRIREAALGAEHPDTAVSMSNLGFLMALTGDPAGARLLYEQALAALEAALGPDHPTTRMIGDNLAALDQPAPQSAAD